MNRVLTSAWVIARRDFTALVRSKAFIAFLVGPIVMLLVALAAGGIAARKAPSVVRPEIGVMMSVTDTARLEQAAARLSAIVDGIPELTPVPKRDPARLAREGEGGADFAAILSGSLDHPRLDTTAEGEARWSEQARLLLDQARRPEAVSAIALEVHSVAARPAISLPANTDRSATAQFGQMALCLATMLLAGMVLSNMVEEKANKIIEILASAVPLEAIFLGKLFAMLAMALIAIGIWIALGLALILFAGAGMPDLTPPAVGWPAYLLLGALYFSTAYLLLGSAYLGIGGMAATVRDVQTLSMPVSMAQLVIFLAASFAMARPGSAVELAACLFPFTSPFASLARAAQQPELWPHLLLFLWQALWTWGFIRLGTSFFRRHVFKSRSGGGRLGRKRPAANR